MTFPIKRSDLEKFLPDERTIRTFERLFAFSTDNVALLERLLAAVETMEQTPTLPPQRLDRLEDVVSHSATGNDVIRYVQSRRIWEAAHILQGLQFGGATDYSTFENDGTLVAYGDAKVWQDIDFPIIIRNTGAGIPTLEVLQGNITVPQWQVNDVNVCEGQEMVHLWKEGSTAYFHIHVVTNGLDASARYLKFEVEWCWADLNGVLSAAATITSPELEIPANTTDKTHKIYSIGTIALTTGHIAAHVWARLKRVAAAGTAPTNNPWCSMLQLHIECDTIGSREMTSK